jgi:hypothetical protein
MSGGAMKHLPLKECGYSIAFVAGLLGTYLAAYFAIVEAVDVSGYLARPVAVVADYPCGGDWTKSFFWPAHRLDQRLRPEVWAGEVTLKTRW